LVANFFAPRQGIFGFDAVRSGKVVSALLIPAQESGKVGRLARSRTNIKEPCTCAAARLLLGGRMAIGSLG
jgi:hypothetical protein